MSRRNELAKAVLAVLDDHGVTERELSTTSRDHQVVRYMYRGARLTYFFSSTPGDVRTLRNTVSGVRRQIRQKEAEA